MKFIKDSLVISLGMAIVFVISQLISDYILPILIGMIVFGAIYILVRRRKKKVEDLFSGSYIEFLTITISILLLIFLTGGINSSFYFLTYFLLFGLSFTFEPLTIFVFLMGILLVFLPQALTDNIIANSIRLGSLILLSPIAFFFGTELKKRDIKQKGK